MEQSTSLFDRFFTLVRPPKIKITISLVLLLLPFAAAYLDQNLDQFLYQGLWRAVLLAPTIIIYILLVEPFMSKTSENVIETLKPLTELNEEDFNRMLFTASRINPWHELIAISIGILLGIASILPAESEQVNTWLLIYWILCTCLMYGILAWTIFIAVSGTRVNATLHSQQMNIDILDPKPFEAVGRQSLLLALVFIGGITISLLFTTQDANISSLAFWITNIIFVLFTMLIFFLSMRPTHRLLADVKKRELKPVQARINSSCRELVMHQKQGQDSGQLAVEINALVAYEERLLAARTWPYNIIMLRTLFFSVFIPLGSILFRLAVDILFPQISAEP